MINFQSYPEYKSTKYPWIGNLPTSWEVRRLKEVGRLFGGAGFPHEYQNLQGEELYFYKVGDLSLSENGKTLLASPHSISKETAKVLRATIIPENAIVYAKIGAALLLNRRRLTTAECCVDNNMTAYVTVAEKVTSEWAFYWLSTIDFGEHVNPGAVPSFSEGYQSVLPIPVPPVDEQEAIARFLDFNTAQIDALIAKKQTLLDKLAEKRTALISHAVTKGLDPSVPMKDSKVEWLGEIPINWKSISVRWLIRIGSGDFISNTDTEFDYSEDAPVPVVGGNGIMAYTSKANTPSNCIVIGRVGAYCGNVHFIKEPSWVTDNALRVKIISDEVSAEFLILALEAIGLNDYANKNAQPLITGEMVKSKRIALPSSVEQVAICRYIGIVEDQIEKQTIKTKSAIDKLREYRSALITNAVTGKIDVREWHE